MKPKPNGLCKRFLQSIKKTVGIIYKMQYTHTMTWHSEENNMTKGATEGTFRILKEVLVALFPSYPPIFFMINSSWNSQHDGPLYSLMWRHDAINMGNLLFHEAVWLCCAAEFILLWQQILSLKPLGSKSGFLKT